MLINCLALYLRVGPLPSSCGHPFSGGPQNSPHTPFLPPPPNLPSHSDPHNAINHPPPLSSQHDFAPESQLRIANLQRERTVCRVISPCERGVTSTGQHPSVAKLQCPAPAAHHIVDHRFSLSVNIACAESSDRREWAQLLMYAWVVLRQACSLSCCHSSRPLSLLPVSENSNETN